MRVKVLIGRFQPFHSEHKRLIDSAMIGANKIIIIIGSANQPRSIKNPWTFQERKNMILACYPYGDKLVIEPLRDISYNDQQWAAGVQKIVNQNTSELDIIELIGHEKDETSFYLRMFPQWSRIDHKMDDSVSATSVRDLYFSGASPKLYSGALPNTTNAALSLFRAGEDYLKLAREYEHIKKYKKSWLAAPYAPTFVTSDAVVVQSGHVLMVVRGAAPGEGLLALPGGFVNQAERIEDGMLRELREETRLRCQHQFSREVLSIGTCLITQRGASVVERSPTRF